MRAGRGISLAVLSELKAVNERQYDGLGGGARRIRVVMAAFVAREIPEDIIGMRTVKVKARLCDVGDLRELLSVQSVTSYQDHNLIMSMGVMVHSNTKRSAVKVWGGIRHSDLLKLVLILVIDVHSLCRFRWGAVL